MEVTTATAAAAAEKAFARKESHCDGQFLWMKKIGGYWVWLLRLKKEEELREWPRKMPPPCPLPESADCHRNMRKKKYEKLKEKKKQIVHIITKSR